jgi:hypothetical protein
MITINSGTVSTVSLRLNDNVVGDSPLFLFEFTSVQSNQVYKIIPQDVSPTERYNQFNLYEITGVSGQNISPTASTPLFELEYGGVYNYKVYEVDDYSMDPTEIILDEGKMVYKNGEYLNFFF